MTTQRALLCGCGAAPGCVRCRRRARLSRENFEGLREAVLRRDDWQCQCCGEVERALLLVHHRRPGWNREQWLVTICRACHVRVHLTFRPRFSGLLRRLWREAHRGLPEQRVLPVLLAERARQVPLPFD